MIPMWRVTAACLKPTIALHHNARAVAYSLDGFDGRLSTKPGLRLRRGREEMTTIFLVGGLYDGETSEIDTQDGTLDGVNLPKTCTNPMLGINKEILTETYTVRYLYFGNEPGNFVLLGTADDMTEKEALLRVF